MLWKKHKNRRTHEATKKPLKTKLVFFAKICGIVMILMLMLGNIVVFAKSVHLSDNISLLEHDITSMRKENEYLQKKMYAEDSLTSLAYSAEQLGFTKQAEPVFFEKPNYAMAQ
jgi:cell division protein FtsL